MMKETNHDYQNCLVGNFYDSNCTGVFLSWSEFKDTFAGGFKESNYDDTYNFVFRYDIDKFKDMYKLELCVMLQRKGIYLHLHIYNITQEELDGEVKEWLKERSIYLEKLWKEVKNEK